MGDKPTGLEAAVARELAAADLPGEGEQLELNDIAQLPLLGEIVVDGRPLKGGRPKGAINKSTKALAAYVLSRHRHPVIAAAEVCDMPLDHLARALRCERLDAARYQQQCREFVARYTLQAMPQSVQVDMSTVGMLMIVNPNAPGPGGHEVQSAHGIAMKVIEQNQRVTTHEDGKSYDEKSHEVE